MSFRLAPAFTAALPPLENALLWTMRAWVIGHSRNRETLGRIEEVYEKLEAPLAARHLDGIMSGLSRGAVRSLEVNCVCHPAISDDEAALLEILALQQQERHEDAYEMLSGMTTESASVMICDSANRLVLALSDAGHRLSIGRFASNRFTPMKADVFDAPRLRYLH